MPIECYVLTIHLEIDLYLYYLGTDFGSVFIVELTYLHSYLREY